MNDFDIYLRHAAVRGGVWVGFFLAWKGPREVAGTSLQPHMRWRPWLLDPANPNDPTLGSWGVWQWQFDVALLDGLVGLAGTPPTDGRTAADMRADLLGYQNVPALDLKDADGAQYSVKMSGYTERLVTPYDYTGAQGGWVARATFAEVTP